MTGWMGGPIGLGLKKLKREIGTKLCPRCKGARRIRQQGGWRLCPRCGGAGRVPIDDVDS